MHIPWGWIKQRPHFFAEQLNQNFEVDIWFKKPWKAKKKHIYSNDGQNFKLASFVVFPFEKIPLLRNIPFLKRINSLMVRFQIKEINHYDFIWVTSVLMYHYISPFIGNHQKLVYDCMDDELEFPAVKNNPILLAKIKREEIALLSRANLVFCSAKYLKIKLLNRTKAQDKIIVLNNAIQLPREIDEPLPESLNGYSQMITRLENVFMYVGTISEWFNFDLVLSMLANNPLANVVLIGPNEVAIPNHDRIHYIGTVERKYIFQFLKLADCLIMPFKVNELIRSVNPVKLYEYIYMDKPIIAPKYEETEQFEPFIYTYSDNKQFDKLCLNLVNKKLESKNTHDANLMFVKNNVWENRTYVVETKLLDL